MSGQGNGVGIIGGGAITQVAHLPVLKKLKGVELPAICDTDLPKARALADHIIRIPMAGRAESLNVAAAAAILMHELTR